MPAIAHENKILGNINTLDDLTDVDLTSPQNGQVLTRRDGEWVNDDPQGGDTSDLIKWSEATTSVKKNLLPITLAEVKANNTSGTWNNNVYTLNSVALTFTANKRGYVTQISANGTAGANTYIKLCNAISLERTQYKLSGNSFPTSSCALYAENHSTGATSTPWANYNNVESVLDVTSDNYTSAFWLSITSGTTLSNQIIKPMLRLASIADATYEPYIPDNIELLQRMEDVQSIDLSSIVTPSSLFEIVYAGVVLRNGIAVLSLRVKCLNDVVTATGYEIVSGLPYIPLGFDNKNIECIGRNITQDNIGVMAWFSGSTHGRFDTTGGTMAGTLLAENDVISFTAIYPYVVNS